MYKLFPNSSWFNQYYAQHLNEDQSGEVDILVGAFMVVKRSLYLEIGGFDENCFMYSDDIDLSYTVKKLGKQNYYFADTTVIHYKGESTVRDGLYMKRFREAMQFFYKKHFKKSVVFDVMMKMGAIVFSFIKKNQQKETEVTIDEYVVFTKNKIQFNLNKKTTYLNDLSIFKNDKTVNLEVVFDTSAFSFKKIIDFMETHKSANITYKNAVFSSDFLIGSNSSNDRGKVILNEN